MARKNANPGNPASISPLEQFERDLHAEMLLVEADPIGYVEMHTPPKEGNPISLGPRVVEAGEWATKQVDRAKAGSAEWLEHSLRPKKVPSKAALEANDKRIDRLQQSLKDKTWEGAMGKVDEDLRLQIIQAKGARGFEDGIDVHKPKVTKVVADLQPRVTALAVALDKMPERTDAEREAKMLAARRGMIELGKARRGIK